MVTRSNLKILVLGATGSIGSAVVETLESRGHRVTGLARSEMSANALAAKGVNVLKGDIRSPENWIEAAGDFDVVIHCAITWTDDMDVIDRKLVEMLIKKLSTPEADKCLVYTSGCWSYGATGDLVASEETPHEPLFVFKPLMEMGEQVRKCTTIRGMVIHPAMVYERDGGTLENMIEDANVRGQVRVVGSKNTRWTMVHAEDIATLYALMIERADAGSVYNGSGTEGIEVYKVAAALAARFGNAREPEVISVEQAVEELGDWARGYGLDQQMSSARAKRELGWQPIHTDVLAEIS